MNDIELKELRERAYGMAVANLNPEDVADYMAIASACARMESRHAVHCMGCVGRDQSAPVPVRDSDTAADGV